MIILSMILPFSACDSNNEVEPQNSSILQYVSVTREPTSDSYSFKFTKHGSWSIYQGTSPQNINMSEPVAETSEESVSISGLNSEQRYFFAVQLDADNSNVAIVSETQLPIKGMPNFADLGGIVTKDGRSVKWGMIYRSGELSDLTDDDLTYMDNLKLKTIVDFRFQAEKEESPDRIPAGVDTISIPVVDGSYDVQTITKWLLMGDTEAFDTMLIHVNKVLAVEEQDNFKKFFNHIEKGETLLFHCTKGKDRAGFAAAMFLSALGVDREIIIDNYLNSNNYLSGITDMTIQYVSSKGLNGELLRPILEVKADYLQTAFDIIDSEYGGIDNYLVNNLGIDVEKLKALYLE
jgi:protein-tyrosine phosphatase